MEAIIYQSSILLIPSHTWIILSSTVNCKSNISFKLSNGTSGVWGHSLPCWFEKAKAGKSGWVMSGTVELGASCAISAGVVRSRFAIGRVVIPCSCAMANGQLLMILLILSSVQST